MLVPRSKLRKHLNYTLKFEEFIINFLLLTMVDADVTPMKNVDATQAASFEIPKDIMLEETPELHQFVGDEIFILATPVLCYNKYGWRNTRILVLT